MQFASSDAATFARAAEMVAKEFGGVDINCGCPQRWACDMGSALGVAVVLSASGVGASLMGQPEKVADVVRATRAVGVPMGVKIRIHPDIRETVEWVRQVVAAGPVRWRWGVFADVEL